MLTVKTRTLFLIGEYKSVSPSVLTEKLALAKSNLALVCKQLSLAGLIEVQSDSIDKRIIYYSLTKAGEAFLQARLSMIEENLTKQHSGTELNKLNESLEKFNEILGKGQTPSGGRGM